MLYWVFLVPIETNVIDTRAIDLPPNSEKGDILTDAIETLLEFRKLNPKKGFGFQEGTPSKLGVGPTYEEYGGMCSP